MAILAAPELGISPQQPESTASLIKDTSVDRVILITVQQVLALVTAIQPPATQIGHPI